MYQTPAALFGTIPSALKQITVGNSATFVYEYEVEGESRILKVIPLGGDYNPAAMRAILEWVAFLTDHGGPAARPIRSRRGNLMEQVEQEGVRLVCVAYEKARGTRAEVLGYDDWSDELIRALGRSLGVCHRLAGEYVPAQAAFRRPEWNIGSNCFNPFELFAGAERGILEKRLAVLEALEPLSKDGESFGLAHLDIHLANFFVDVEARTFGLFDFDDCAYGWYVMDIAMLLFDILVVYKEQDPKSLGARFLTNLLRGYRQEKAVSDFWVGQVPLFLKLLEIGVYLDCSQFYDPAVPGIGWSGKFMPGRRERILAGTSYVDLDFTALSRQAGIDLQ